MQKDYDAYYQILRIPEGSGLSEVESAWKHWAPLLHPDNFAAGPLKDRAHGALAELNNARDELRKWWASNSQPPPSKRTAAPPPAPAPSPAPSEKTWQEKAYEDWKKEQHAAAAGASSGAQKKQERHWRGYADPQGGSSAKAEPPPKPKTPAKPFGPKPLIKEWNHHVYDLMNSSRDDAAIPSMLLWAALFVVPGLIVPVVLTGLGVPAILSFLIVAPFAIKFWINTFADRALYAIEVNPYLQPCPAPAQDVMKKIDGLIDGKKFEGQKWELATIDLDPDDDILAKDWTTSLKSGERTCLIKLNVRVRQTDELYQSMISYWFDIDGTANRTAAAKVVKATDEALWRGLKA
jgi:hypothetical protein